MIEVDELDDTSILEFTEVLAVPVENGSSAVLQTQPSTCNNTQPDRPSKGSASVRTQTSNEYTSQSSIPKHQPEYGPLKRFSRKEEEMLHTEELDHIKGIKVICSLDLLLQQFAGQYKFPGCIHSTALEYSLLGTCAVIRWKCPAGHKGRFCTSEDVNGMLSNNLQAAASVLTSRNTFSKVENFAKHLRLEFISVSTFQRVQKLYCAPVIDEWWQNMRRIVGTICQ